MRTKIIAELAQGYEGNPRQTLELTKAALRSNCDVIKFFVESKIKRFSIF